MSLRPGGVDLNTVAGRIGHAEDSTTLWFYAQFTRTADQQAAAIIPASLDGKFLSPSPLAVMSGRAVGGDRRKNAAR